MELNDEKNKINEDLVVFTRKRSDTNAPRYTARLKTYLELQHKRQRAASARLHSNRKSITDKKEESKDKNEVRANPSNAGSTQRRKSNCGMSGEHPGSEERMSRRRGGNEKGLRIRSLSRSHSSAPSDRCGRRRRRRGCGRRRRRRSCRRRRRRRRRSCRRRRRRSCRRRRKRRCSRRRRRRSCRRRRRSRRRRSCRRRRRRRC